MSCQEFVNGFKKPNTYRFGDSIAPSIGKIKIRIHNPNFIKRN